MKKPVYRLDNKVKIINPELFIRCGYPWTKEYVKNNLITQEQKDLARKLLVGIEERPAWIDIGEPAGFDEILNVLAYQLLVKNRYGGKERTIHTELKEEFRGIIGRVVGKKVKRTGTYNHGSYYGGYDGGEYDPPYLSGGASHVILELNCYTMDNTKITPYSTIFIEEKNVEKVVD